MWVSTNIVQDLRIALATMAYDGVFERFPFRRGGEVPSSPLSAFDGASLIESRMPSWSRSTLCVAKYNSSGGGGLKEAVAVFSPAV